MPCSTESSPKACVIHMHTRQGILTHSPGQDTPTGAKLGQIIDHYLPLVEHEHSTHEPITILVITDGLPSKLRFIRTH